MSLWILRWRIALARRIGIMVLAFLGRYILCPLWPRRHLLDRDRAVGLSRPGAPGRRVETLIVVTTLTDPQAYSKEDIAELDILQIKQTLHLDHVRCKTPEMVRRELWVTLLTYNLIRKVIATSAAVHAKQPRHLGFTLACQTLLASWMLLATGSCRDTGAMYHTMLAYRALFWRLFAR